MSSVKEHFNNLITRLQPIRVMENPKPKPSFDQILAAELHEWSADDRAQDAFLPWLAQQIELVEQDLAVDMASHPMMTYHKGRKDMARFIESKFHEWSGTRPQAPRQKE